jgi:hypothetical protein
MSSHDLTIAGYVLITSAAVGLQLLGYAGRWQIPAFGHVMSRIMRTRSVRVGVIAGWAWLGLHFFAR